LGGAIDDRVIIRQLPLFLSDTARAWLKDLPPRQIHDWDDLVRVFEGNFKGTYMRLGNSWDLRSCKQKPGESLRDYIRRFSRQRTELPNITDSNVIMAFLSGTTCKELVRELGRKTPLTANELMDIITNFAAGEEAVGAIFGGD
jgi:broad specificity phosphatase PhoE